LGLKTLVNASPCPPRCHQDTVDVLEARNMAQDLRDRQMELTRDLILGALIGLIAEGRLAEFSV
jgi:hypothetical protein